VLKAIILLSNGGQEDAGEWAERAMEHCQKAGCVDKGRILNVQGRVALAAGAHDTAETMANKAMAENRKNKNQVETANSIRLLAETAEARGKTEVAIEQYQRALAIDREEKLGNKIAMDLLGLARGYSVKKNIELATLFAKRALIVSNAADCQSGARAASELLEKLNQ
ncbi:MAG: tetratricopeptide repeat protein, partial [Nitrospinota bacterium]|nr:tetratricopeptide repeat protein [Nitrospinota bacterium]